MSRNEQIMREHARLIILRVLRSESNGTLNSALLQEHLETYGVMRPREWVHAEVRWLASMDAVAILEAGSVLVATIKPRGINHVDKADYGYAIEGVKRPSTGG